MSILKSVLRGGVAAQPIAARLPCARAAGGGHTAHLQKPKAPPSLHLHAHQHHPANAPFHIQGIRRAPPHIKGAHGSAIAGYSPLALPPDDHPYAPYVDPKLDRFAPLIANVTWPAVLLGLVFITMPDGGGGH
eukprot:GHVT01077866.1.p1 GENE.GHVT01077866.1~~GHVT01077866.1.p1  ORF type:complete len:133 (-),score=18.16 GHVT01077866.1:1018-1416(-)